MCFLLTGHVQLAWKNFAPFLIYNGTFILCSIAVLNQALKTQNYFEKIA